MNQDNEKKYREEFESYIKDSPYRMKLIDIGIMNGVPMLVEFEEVYLAACKKRQEEMKKEIRDNEDSVTFAAAKLLDEKDIEIQKLKEEIDRLSSLLKSSNEEVNNQANEAKRFKNVFMDRESTLKALNKICEERKDQIQKRDKLLEQAKLVIGNKALGFESKVCYEQWLEEVEEILK